MTAAAAAPAVTDRNVKLGAGLMAVAGLGFVGYGVIFFVLNFSSQFLELGISQNEVPVTRGEIVEFSPELFHYVSHLHIAIAGFLVALGVAVASLAWVGVRRGEPWAWWTAAAVPVIALAIALPAHYPNSFDTLAHLGLIYLATAIFVLGALLSLPVARSGR
jgi:hypothetical protein